MKRIKTHSLLLAPLLAATPLVAQDAAKPAPDPAAPKEASELDKLTKKNAMIAEQLKAKLAAIRAEVAKLKLEKELLKEKAELEQLKRAAAENKARIAFENEQVTHQREAIIAKAKADKFSSELKEKQAAWSLKTLKLRAEIEQLQAQKQRDFFTDNKPVYLDNPLTKNNVLVISDRRIALNGPITGRTADYITDRLHFYNNKDKKKPIFIVIDDCPGGSVMAGYRILKAMEGSDAPIHVVVKSFAASMAATITTLAEESYAYPNAIIMHHQISSTLWGSLNLTEQKEFYEDSVEWWKRLAEPLAKKMGFTTDEFIKKMYAKNTSGDWSEFATEAQKLKWVKHIVKSIKETAIDINPNSKKAPKKDDQNGLKESTDINGRRCMILPRLNPKDVYFLHNPDNYYRLK